MKLIRYSLFLDDTPQDIGIFHALDSWFSENKIRKLLTKFDEELIIPDYNSFNLIHGKEYTESFFTEKGYQEFKKDIVKIQQAVRNLGLGFSIKQTTITISEEYPSILYKDEYQVIIKKIY